MVVSLRETGMGLIDGRVAGRDGQDGRLGKEVRTEVWWKWVGEELLL